MADFNLSVLIKAVDEASGTFKEIQKNASDFKTEMEKTSSESSSAWSAVGNKMQTVGKGMESVGGTLTKGVTVPLVGMGVASVKTASDFETSMAQLQTIMDTSQVSVDDMRQGIMDLSNQTGISASEIATSAYSAISAGQDTDKALQAVETSAQLAKAGFTDSGTALDTLTTIMNSYGMSADQMEGISDRLITTQNLGKTTVDELGASMGKVIPTANMYGVNLDNIASAYVTTTKNGISTAESTTYINGMLNELGKSGSTVSEVLKEKTGKSFKELMDDGYSLSDVLKIVQDKADETGVSMGDMFSSQEAGKAAATIVQHAEDFNGAMDSMQKSAGATQTAFETMDSTTGANFTKTINQIKNDSITVGQNLLTVLAPAISQVSGFIADMSAKFQALSPAQQEVITKVGLAVAVAGPLITVIGKVVGSLGTIITTVPNIVSAFGTFGGAISTVGTFITGTAIPAIGSFITTIAGVVAPFLPVIAIIGAVIAVGVLLYKNWDTIKQKAGELKDWIGEKWEGIKTATSETWEGIKSTIGEKWDAVKTHISDKWNEIQVSFYEGGGGISGVTEVWFDQINNTVRSIMDGISKFTGINLDGLKESFTTHWQNIRNAVVDKIYDIQTNMKDKFNSAKESALNIFGNIKSGIENKIGGARDFVKGAIDRIKGFFNFSWSLPPLKLPHFTISGHFSLNPPSVPHFGIEWYKKAYDQAMMFTQPTVMGSTGFGDGSGNEVVVGDDHLVDLIQTALAGAGGGNITIPVYIGQERIDEIVVKSNQRVNFRSGGRG